MRLYFCLYLLNKALALNKTNYMAHFLRGQLFQLKGRQHDAIISFKNARTIRNDLAACRGLFQAYLALKNDRAATILVNELSQLPEFKDDVRFKVMRATLLVRRRSDDQRVAQVYLLISKLFI